MKDYKRLTTRANETTVLIDTRKFNLEDGLTEGAQEWEATKKMVFRLADLEDKIDNGTLIELPCKVGDKVWIILNELWTLKPFVDESVAKSVSQIVHWIEFEELGTLVFLTKAEAEAKLRELQGD